MEFKTIGHSVKFINKEVTSRNAPFLSSRVWGQLHHLTAVRDIMIPPREIVCMYFCLDV